MPRRVQPSHDSVQAPVAGPINGLFFDGRLAGRTGPDRLIDRGSVYIPRTYWMNSLPTLIDARGSWQVQLIALNTLQLV